MRCHCNPPRWAELTAEEQLGFGNGCGPKWLPNPITKLLFGWFFDASCRRHDFGYARGGSHADKMVVDKGFYLAMLRDAERLAEQQKPVQHISALFMTKSFYVMVRSLGWMQFNYGPYQSKEQMLKV